MIPTWRVRPETAADVEAVRAVHVAAFPSPLESRLVDALRAVGLAPAAVLPRAQRRGAGSRLIEAGLARATELGYDFVVVLGEPDYYHRFGFATASRFGLANDYGVDEPFMARALHADGLRGASGLVSYQPEFALVASETRATSG